jgi:hypothetical protein
VAIVEFGPPPGPRAGMPHAAYKPWLLAALFDHVCAYCVRCDEGVEVDHYEPTSFAPGLVDDPSNLLLACGRCNGPGGKGDYHPAHTMRRRLPKDRSGFHVLDIRRDDFASMFDLDDDGVVHAQDGPQRDRAAWNIVLLKLDRYSAARREVIDLKESCEIALNELRDPMKAASHPYFEALLERLLPELARRVLLLVVHDAPISHALTERIAATRARLGAT